MTTIGVGMIGTGQIALANQVFTPDAHIVDKTHRIIAAMKHAAANGSGAVSLDGRLIDAASIRMAETLLAKLEQIEAKGDASTRKETPRPRKSELHSRDRAEAESTPAPVSHLTAGGR